MSETEIIESLIKTYGLRKSLEGFIKYVENISVQDKYLTILKKDLETTLLHYESRYENDE